MRNTETRRPTRLLAAFLVVMMVFSLLPTYAFADAQITITVNDNQDQPISGATAICKMLDDRKNVLETKTGTTDGNGKATITLDTEGAAYYLPMATKQGYAAIGGYEHVNIANAADVTITLAPVVSFTLTGKSSLTYNGNKQALVEEVNDAGGAEIKYAVFGENEDPGDSASIPAEKWKTEVPEAKDAGNYIVYAKGTKEGYTTTSKSVNVTIAKADIPGFELTAKAAANLVYTGSDVTLVEALTIDGVDVTYAVTADNTQPADDAFGEYNTAVGKNVGTYYVWAKGVKNPADKNYNTAYASKTVAITQANAADFTIVPKENLAYTGADQALINAVSVENATVYYGVSDVEVDMEDVNTVEWAETVPECKNAGTYRVWAVAMPSDSTNYKPLYKYVNVTIDKKDVSAALKIYYEKNAEGMPPAFTEGTADGWKGTVGVVVENNEHYNVKVVAGNEIETSDQGEIIDGKLVISVPGQYTVKLVIVDEDGNPDPNLTCTNSETYLFQKTLNNVRFDEDETANVTYTLKDNSTDICTYTADVDAGNIDSETLQKVKVTYALAEGSKDLGFAVDTDTGKVTVSDLKTAIESVKANGGTLSIKIEATNANNEYYASCTDSYTITVKFADAPQYTVSGTTAKVEGVDWYCGDFAVTAEGYTSYNGFDQDGKLQKSVVEGEHANEDWYFVNNSTHEISTAVLPLYCYDETAPVIGKIEIGYDALQTLGSVIFFDITGKDSTDARVSVEVTDAGVGVATVVVNAPVFDGGELTLTDSDQNGTFTAEVKLAETVPSNDTFAVTARDALGNEATKNTYKTAGGQEAVLRVAAAKPVVTVTSTAMRRSKVEVVITIEDPYFDENGVEATAHFTNDIKGRKDDKELTLASEDWTHEGNKHTFTHTYSYGDRLILSDLVFPLYMNVSVEYTNILKEVIVSKPPVESDPATLLQVRMACGEEDIFTGVEGAVHYITTGVPQITVVDEFLPANVADGYYAVSVTKDGSDYTSSVQFSNWAATATEKEYAMNVPLDKDGEYTVKLDFNYAEGETKSFVSDKIIVDNTKPTVNVEYNAEANSVSDNIYYKSDITATVTVTEKNFDKSKVTFTATKDGQPFTVSPSEWTDNAADNTHTCTVTLNADGKYTLGIACVDLAGNALESDYASKTLIRDTVKPVLDVKYNDDGSSTEYSTAVNYVTFGAVTKYYYAGPITASISVTELNFDEASEALALTVTKDGEAYTAYQLSPWTNGKEENEHVRSLLLSEDGEYVITVNYKDLATNLVTNEQEQPYTSSPVIKDTVNPAVNVTSTTVTEYDDIVSAKSDTLTVTVTEKNFDTANSYVKVYRTNAKGVAENNYGDTAYLTKTAADWVYNSEDGTYSATVQLTEEGCYKVELDVIDYAMHKNTEATLNNMDEGKPTRLGPTFAPAIKFILDATEPELTWELSEGFKPQTVSTVGTPDKESFGYFKWKTAKDEDNKDITVSDAAIVLTATDEFAGVDALHYAYYIANKVSSVNKGNQDNTQTEKDEKKLTFEDVVIALAEDTEFKDGFQSGFDTDGKMTATYILYIPREALTASNQFNGYLEFYATDFAQNENSEETDIVPLNTSTDALKSDGKEFTRIVVDSIDPSVTLAMNAPVNVDGGINYYNGPINVSVTVKEANFYPADISADINGAGVGLNWGGDYDNHYAAYTITADGTYTTKVSYKEDRSGNLAHGTFQSGTMIIDTVIEDPVITVNGADANGKAYKGDAVLGIKFEDINYDRYDIKVTRTTKGEKDKDVTAQFINKTIPTTATGGEATFDTFKKVQENDGIYTVTVRMYDKALHMSSATATFSVNRFGSVYEYSDELAALIKDGGQYVQEVPSDLVIKEFNPDRLVADSVKVNITRDGKPVSGVKFTATPVTNDLAAGTSGWYEYAYTIDKSNFAEDGVYTVSVSSQDAAGNTPENTNYADMGITFYVDHTAPELTNVVGLEEAIINASELDVNYSVFENIALASVAVYVDGEKVAEITDFSEDRNSFNGVLKLLEKDNAQNVRFVLTDLAGNVTDTAEEAFFAPEAVAARYYTMNPDVTVSTKWVVRWYANKPLFYGTIIGGAAALGIVFFLIFGRKKKEDDKEQAAKA